MFGARGLCGQRVLLVAVQALGRESARVTVLLPKMAGNLVAVPRSKWETAVTDLAQVNECNISLFKTL